MKVKTSELSGIALDYAVSLANKREDIVSLGGCYYRNPNNDLIKYSPSTSWIQCGPVIESNKIDTFWDSGNECWDASMDKGRFVESGPTLLIAAMRCFVASKLGDEVDIPEELL